MRLRSIILLTVLAAAFSAMADDGTVVPLSDLKKSSVLKKDSTTSDNNAKPARPSYTDDESGPTPAIPEMPGKNSSAEIPAVPEMPDVPSAGELPAVPGFTGPSSPASSLNKTTSVSEKYSDENSLPAPMGPATASVGANKDLLGKKTIPVTMPRDRRIIHRKLELNSLPENASVIGKIGTIYKGEDGWFWVKYEIVPGAAQPASQRLLPCRILQSVEDILAQKPDTRFGIYGQAMLYDGMTYLMLRRVTVEDDNKKQIAELRLSTDNPDETYKAVVANAKAAAPVETAKASAQDTSAEPVTAEDAIARTNDLMAGLMSETEGTTIRTTDAPARTAEENKTSVAPAGQEPLSQGRENLVIDRLARVVKSKHSDWYEVHFISDNTLREPPYLILPNSKLDDSLRLNSYLGFHERKLRISGEVVFYKGRRYILLTKVFPERDMRQF